MSIAGMAGRIITVYRRTASVLDARGVSLTMTLDRPLQNSATLEVTVTGGTGDLTITGVVNGASDTEVLTFTGGTPEVRRTIKVFDSVSELGAVIGLRGFNISVNAIGEDGSRIYVHYVVMSGVRMHLNHGVPYWRNPKEGSAQLQDVWFGIDYTSAWTPREGDVFFDKAANQQYMVTGPPEYLGSVQPHHWEVRAKRRAGTVQI
jgi:hypothetical protein